MPCEHAQQLFEQLLEGSLAPEIQEQVMEHVLACDTCRTAFNLFQDLRRGGDSLLLETPADFDARLREGIDRLKALGATSFEIYLPDVHYYGAEDLSMLGRYRYFLFRNFYRRRMFRVLGEYFSNTRARELFVLIERFRDQQRRDTGKTISFSRAATRWKAQHLEAWKATLSQPVLDQYQGLVARSKRQAAALGRRMPRIVRLLPWVLGVLGIGLIVWLVAALSRPQLRVLHLMQGQQALVLERTVRGWARQQGMAVVFRRLRPETLVNLLQQRGVGAVLRHKPDLLIMNQVLARSVAGLGAVGETRFAPSQMIAELRAHFPDGVGNNQLPLWYQVPLIVERGNAAAGGDMLYVDGGVFESFATCFADQAGVLRWSLDGRECLLQIIRQHRSGRIPPVEAWAAIQDFRSGLLDRLLLQGEWLALALQIPRVRLRPLEPEQDRLPPPVAVLWTAAVAGGSERPGKARALARYLARPGARPMLDAGVAPALAGVAVPGSSDHLQQVQRRALAGARFLRGGARYLAWRRAFPEYIVYSALWLDQPPLGELEKRLTGVTNSGRR